MSHGVNDGEITLLNRAVLNSTLSGPRVRSIAARNLRHLVLISIVLSDRILMGAERRSHYVTPENKKMTAYHEAGHALTGLKTVGAMPLHKVYVAGQPRTYDRSLIISRNLTGLSCLEDGLWV